MAIELFRYVTKSESLSAKIEKRSKMKFGRIDPEIPCLPKMVFTLKTAALFGTNLEYF
jgi:hypothetical protein